MLSQFAWDGYSLAGCVYAGCMVIFSILTMALLLHGHPAAYRCTQWLNGINAARCVLFSMLLVISIVRTALAPPPAELDLHIPIFFLMVPVFFFIAAELAECAVHIANMVYFQKRRRCFLNNPPVG